MSTTTTTDENLSVDTTTDVTTEQVITNEEEGMKPHDLRLQLKREKEAKAKLKAELDSIKQAEEDRLKSTEEKLAEERRAKEDLAKEMKALNASFAIKEALLKSKVNPEFTDLILNHAKSRMDPEDLDVEGVISELQSEFPSAFVKEDPTPKPIGKTGVSSNTGQVSTYTKDQVAKMILDPNQVLTPELTKLADEYGL